MYDRNSKELCFQFNHRFLVYFAVDLYEIAMTTELKGKDTFFYHLIRGQMEQVMLVEQVIQLILLGIRLLTYGKSASKGYFNGYPSEIYASVRRNKDRS